MKYLQTSSYTYLFLDMKKQDIENIIVLFLTFWNHFQSDNFLTLEKLNAR